MPNINKQHVLKY